MWWTIWYWWCQFAGTVALLLIVYIQNAAVVNTRDTARLVRQHRLDGSPFVIPDAPAFGRRGRV